MYFYSLSLTINSVYHIVKQIMLVHVPIACLKYFMIFKACVNVYVLYFKITIKIKDAGIVFKDILNLLRLIERYMYMIYNCTNTILQYNVPMIFSLFHCH